MAESKDHRLFSAATAPADILKRLGPDAKDAHWRTEILEDRVWEREWLQYAVPLEFGDTLLVCSSRSAAISHHHSDRQLLRLDPGLAFGTGTHPTTAMCLDWLADNPLVDQDIVDYGCGSGILAVAALLLGAKHAYAVDIDPQALTACRDNSELNGITQSRLTTSLAGELPEIKADIVVANILAEPLLTLAPLLIGLLRPGAHLILSGLLVHQQPAIHEAYCGALQLIDASSRENWLRLVMRRPMALATTK